MRPLLAFSRATFTRTALTLGLALGAAQAAPPDVYIAYPPDNHTVNHDHVLLEGSVTPGADLRINGRAIPVGPDGLFIEWLPLIKGHNDLRLNTRLGDETGTARLRITRNAPAPTPARPTIITPGTLSPSAPITLHPTSDPTDRAITVSLRGSPGARGTIRVGPHGTAPLTERQPGRYEGTLNLPPGTTLNAAPINVTLTGPDGKTTTATAPGTVTVTRGPRVAIVTDAGPGSAVNSAATAARLGQYGPEYLYPKLGQRLLVTGVLGDQYRVRLAPGLNVYLPARAALLAPDTTPQPNAALKDITVTDIDGWTEVRLPLTDLIPFALTNDGETLDVKLFHTVTATPPTASPTGRSVTGTRTLTVDGTTTVTLTLTPGQLWGYTATYEGNTLLVRVKHPPAPLQASTEFPLAGKRILIDAGHGGTQSGGAGPLRVPEKDLVLPIALRAAQALRQLGADVTLTRETDTTVPLYDRPVLAETTRADLLVSVHGNAIPDGVDPRTRRGVGIYYTHPMALNAAQTILGALLAAVPETGRDGTGLFERSLALTRPTSQPSILVEHGYLTDPGNLRLLMDPAVRDRMADALAAGIVRFFQEHARD